MQRLLLVLSGLLLLPSAALAQASAFVSADPVGDGAVNATECQDDATLRVEFALDQPLADNQVVAAFTSTSEDCTDAGRVTDVTVSSETTLSFSVSDLIESCADIEDETRWLCLELADVPSATTPVAFEIDTVAPGPPTSLSVEGGDSSLSVEWTFDDTPTDLSVVQLQYREATSTGDFETVDIQAGPGSGRISGLTNGVEYEVQAVSIDEVGNEGDPSDPVTGTPVESSDFWEFYREQGGAQTGGCSSGSGSGLPALLLLAVGLFLVRRRGAGRRLPALLIAASVLAVPAGARAADDDVEGWVDPDRNFWLEIDIGPYRPEVDSEFSDASPYQDIFGSGSELLFHVRGERALWQGIGQVDVGLSAGFAQAVGKALRLDGSSSADTTVFNWIPLQLSATYRLDYAALHWNIPFVPFVRAGLNGVWWWVLDNTGDIAEAQGEEAMGLRTGFSYGAGLMFLLDVLDPRLATDFARSSGVDNSYIFAEVKRLEIDGFGSQGFVLSDTTWFAGLAIEF